MQHREYGQTGKEVSIIGFGGMRFANPQDIDGNAEIVLHAYDRGVNYFDTAPQYCDDRSEDIVGAALRQMKPGTFYISTKCSASDGGKLRESLERSLKRLGVERIHFFHIWCVMTPEAWARRKQGGAVAAALKAKDEGLVEHVVMSSHMTGDDIEAVLNEGILEGVTLGYCALNFPYRQKGVEAAGRLGLGVVTMNPLGGGVIPNNAERLSFLRGPDDPSVVAAALRFNLSNPNVTCALVGCTTKQHVDEAVEAVESFTPYSPERIEQIRSRILEGFNDLCTGCGYCLPCPSDLNIPAMMDVYNMKLLPGGQGMLSRLKWHWGLSQQDADACSDCGECEEKCTQHLPIRERLKEIAAISDEPSEETD